MKTKGWGPTHVGVEGGRGYCKSKLQDGIVSLAPENEVQACIPYVVGKRREGEGADCELSARRVGRRKLRRRIIWGGVVEFMVDAKTGQRKERGCLRAQGKD